MGPAADGVHTVTTFIPRQVSNPQLRGYAIPFVPTPAPQAAPPVNVDSPRLSANATVFIPGSSSVVLNPPQVDMIRGLTQEHEVPSTDTDSNTSGEQESISSAQLSDDSTLVFDDSVSHLLHYYSFHPLTTSLILYRSKQSRVAKATTS